MDLVTSFLLSILLFPVFSFERIFAEPLYNTRTHFAQDAPFPLYVAPKNEYQIFLIGDSMTAFLGGGEEIQKNLGKNYPKKKIDILNYGIGSTTIETVPGRLESGSVKGAETLFPVFHYEPDVIFIESFGNNPINLPLEEGLAKQTEALDKIVEMIKKNKPKAVIVFMATISPNRRRYGDGVYDLTRGERKKWAEERIAYMKNHIEYAKVHKVPLLNVFEKSLDTKGDGDIDYLESNDFIHPSPTGIKFISQEIADFLFNNRILPL